MASAFDPYHRWLAIPPEEQPPHAYRLLGVKLFEEDTDVIASAADRQMSHLRTFQTGPHSRLSQRLLNEVAAAKVMLLSAEKKSRYDAELRARLGPPPASATAPLPPPVPPPGPPAPPPISAVPTHVPLKEPPPAPPLAAATNVPLGPVLAEPPAANLTPPPLVPAGVPGYSAGEPAADEDLGSSWMSVLRRVAIAMLALVMVSLVVALIARHKERAAAWLHETAASLQRPAGPPAAGSKPAEAGPVPTPGSKPARPKEPEVVEKPAVEAVAKTVASPMDTPPAPADVVPSKPPAEPSSKQKLALPSHEEQNAVAKQLAEICDIDGAKTSAAKRKLAGELFEQGRRPEGKPTERFVMLRKATELAADGGDAELMYRAADAIAADYEIDLHSAKAKLLARFAGDASRAEAAIAPAKALIDESLKHRRLDVALEVAVLAYQASQRPGGTKYRKEMLQRRREIQALYDEDQKVRQALAVVEKNPDNPEANLLLGRHYCFAEGDWERGLPHLAASSDAELAAAAERDRQPPPDKPEDQVALADLWWDLAEKREGRERDALLLRAGWWYRQAEPDTPAGLVRLKISKRLKEIELIRPPAMAAEESTASTELPAQGAFPRGKWVDLTPWIDLERGVVEGSWKRDSSGVLAEPGDNARIMLPVSIEGSYDLEVEFTRRQGNDAVALLLPIGSAQCAVVLSAAGGKAHGLALVDGRDATDPQNPVSRRPGMLQNGRKTLIRVAIRHEGAKGTIEVVRDGRFLMRTFGALNLLAVPAPWQLAAWKRPGLGAHQSEVCFHRVRLRLANGAATVVREGGATSKSRSLAPSPDGKDPPPPVME